MLERVKTNLTAGSKFIKGENISILENDLKQVVVQLMKNIDFLKRAIQQKNLKSQWDVVLEHPYLDNLTRFPSVVVRVCIRGIRWKDPNLKSLPPPSKFKKWLEEGSFPVSYTHLTLPTTPYV